MLVRISKLVVGCPDQPVKLHARNEPKRLIFTPLFRGSFLYLVGPPKLLCEKWHLKLHLKAMPAVYVHQLMLVGT